MAWSCSASSNKALVDNLVRKNLVSSPRAERAMRSVDRQSFTPASTNPYADSPQPLPCAATISAPHMHAMALDFLEPYLKDGSTALDVGAGSGYFTALMAQLVGTTGYVVGVEHAPELADLANRNLRAFDHNLLRTCVDVRTGDGRAGAPDKVRQPPSHTQYQTLIPPRI